jgi:hypothetical protein
MNPDAVKAGIVHARASGQQTGKMQGAVVVGGLALVVVGVVVFVSSQQNKVAVAQSAAVATNEGRAQGYSQALEEQRYQQKALERSRVYV